MLTHSRATNLRKDQDHAGLLQEMQVCSCRSPDHSYRIWISFMQGALICHCMHEIGMEFLSFSIILFFFPTCIQSFSKIHYMDLCSCIPEFLSSIIAFFIIFRSLNTKYIWRLLLTSFSHAMCIASSILFLSLFFAFLSFLYLFSGFLRCFCNFSLL